MRFLTSLVGGVIVAIAAVLLTLFALENSQVVGLNFLGNHFSGNIWWLILGAAAIGFLLALLLTVPGRMVTGYRAHGLSRANAQHEQTLAELRDTHAQMQAERDRLSTEHDRMSDEHRHLREELVATRSERDQARQERDGLRTAHGEVGTERDQLRAERDQLRAEVTQMRQGHDQLGAERDRLDTELRQARDEQAHLRDEQERVMAERDQLRERLAAMPAVAPVNAAGYRPTVEPALMGAASGAVATEAMTAREDQVVGREAPEEPVMPEAQDAQDTVVAREPAVTQPAHPSIGERIRAAVTGEPVEQTAAADETQEAQETQPGGALVPEAIAATGAAQPGDEHAADAARAAENEPVIAPTDDTAPVRDENAPTLGERLHAMFTGQSVQEVRAEDMGGADERAAAERAADVEPEMPEARIASKPLDAQPTGDHAMATAPNTTEPVTEPEMPAAQALPPVALDEMTGAANAPMATVAESPESPEMPPAQATSRDVVDAAPGETEQPAEPTLGERLRAMFHRDEAEPTPPEQVPPERAPEPTA